MRYTAVIYIGAFLYLYLDFNFSKKIELFLHSIKIKYGP